MSTDAEKQAKAERKAEKKAEKKAAKKASQAANVETVPGQESKKRKAEDGQEPVSAISKKQKKEPENSSVAQSEPVDEKSAAKEAKRIRREEKRLAKQQNGNANGSEVSRQAPSTIIAPIAVASTSEVESFLEENGISYEPAEAATVDFPPVLSFAGLSISEGLRQGLKTFTKPTPIQSAAWGVLLRGKDCIAIAETGSGKTMAFGLPAIKYIESLGLSKKSKKGKSIITVLVLAPTRELAMQTHDVLSHLGQPLSLDSICIYGGVPKDPQKQALAAPATRIVVGTPGRIIDLCNEGALDLSNVTYLVLDEADRMLDKGFENDIRTIIGSCAPEQRQTMMFSATWPLSVRKLANDFMKEPIRIVVGSDELTASASVDQKVVVLQDGRMKDGELLKVLSRHGFKSGSGGGQKGAQRNKVLVFALYKKEAARVERFLQAKGFEVGCIQGDLGQAQRTKALDDFKTGKTAVLVATDVAARGLDVPKVELVVNYTFPLLIEDYVHRIGRTGRAGAKGNAVTFFTEDDKAHSGELQRVLKDGNHEVPEALAAFGGTIKKKSHPIYGDHYDESLAGKKGTKITF